jgi:hypothetical protein
MQAAAACLLSSVIWMAAVSRFARVPRIIRT